MTDFLGNIGGYINDAANFLTKSSNLPFVLPAAGAAIGGIAGGGKGALEGAGAGALAGQLVGTGAYAPLSSGGRSVLGGLLNPSGTGIFGGGYGGGGAAPTAAAVTAAGPTDPFGFGVGGLGSDAGGNLTTTGITGVPGGLPSGSGVDFSGGGPSQVNTPDTSDGGFMDLIKKNPSLLLGAGVLGLDALKGNKIPELGPIEKQAAQLAKQGQQLTSALTTGRLPAGAQASVDEAVRSNQAAIRSEFASMGLSGSTMETTSLNEAALRGTQLGFQIASEMATLGLKETGLSSELLTTIANAQLQSDTELSNSIANFAAALAGGTRFNQPVR